MMTGLRRPQTLFVRDLSSRAPPSSVVPPFLPPHTPARPHPVPILNQLPSFFQERTVFLCLPGRVGAAVSGYFSVHWSFLAPHPADAWAGL